MREIRTYPYLTPKIETVKIQKDWQLIDANRSLVNDPDAFLAEWDPAQSIYAKIEIVTSLQTLLDDCGLAPDSRLRAVSGWRSSGTMLRSAGQVADLIESNSEKPIVLAVEVSGTNVSYDVTFFAAIILISAGDKSDPLAPKLPGSVLWFKERSYNLNNYHLLFPIELIDFRLLEAQIPANAAWYLDWNPSDLHQTVLGDVRLYLNSAHPMALQAIMGESSSTEIIQNYVFFDIARTLLLEALKNKDFSDTPNYYPQGSVGSLIQNIISEYFLDENLHSLRNLAKDVSLFEAYLQHRLEFLSN